MNLSTVRILLVEDSEDDVFLLRRALKKAGLDMPIQIVMDGQQALDYLNGAGKFADRSAHPIPQLVFLDLKLPYVHGFDVLQRLRNNPDLKDMCVVVLTSSPEERDRKRAAELGAKAYLVKPPTPEMVLHALEFLDNGDRTAA